MELTAIILAHGPTAPSIWEYLRSVPLNILNSCTGAAFWSSSDRKGPCSAECCTYKSVGHGKQDFIQYFCLTTSDKRGCSNSVAKHLYATISNSPRHSRKIYLEFSFRDYSTCQFFLCSLDSLVVPPKSMFVLGGRRGQSLHRKPAQIPFLSPFPLVPQEAGGRQMWTAYSWTCTGLLASKTKSLKQC